MTIPPLSNTSQPPPFHPGPHLSSNKSTLATKLVLEDIPTIISVDPAAKVNTQRNVHTRHHPEIPACVNVAQGETFRVECVDFSGNQILNDDCADDVLGVDWDTDHTMSGPIAVEGAEPGDALIIDVIDVRPFPDRQWGYSLVLPGVGPLDRPDTKVAKSIWEFKDSTTWSRHIPHVQFQGKPHVGLISTAPSAELLELWALREQAIDGKTRKVGGCQGHHEMVSLPTESGAYVGQDLDDEVLQRIKSQGARTSPTREHGGNIDAGNLSSGSKIILPVYVPGANLSVGDLHFSIGDGEPTCAIEMAGIVTLKCTVVKDGIKKYSLKAPMVMPNPNDFGYRDQVIFHGLSLASDGEQLMNDGRAAYINAARSAQNYLESFGFTQEQTFMLMAAAPIETKFITSACAPNTTVGVGIPTEMFDFDIRPSAEGPQRQAIAGPAVLSAEGERKYLAEQGLGH